jgi:hypothetical protein
MKRKLLLVGVVAVSVLAIAASPQQQYRPRAVMTPDDTSLTYHWGPYDATTGALFDAGYQANSLAANAYPSSIEGTAALVAAECEARMLRDGVNNARSNIVEIRDDTTGRRLSHIVFHSAVLDAGLLVSHGGASQAAPFYRPLAGGDAGMPWSRIAGFLPAVTTATAAAAPNTGLFMSALSVGDGMGTAGFGAGTSMFDGWAPGYYCFIPYLSMGYGVSHIWVRTNRVFVPR